MHLNLSINEGLQQSEKILKFESILKNAEIAMFPFTKGISDNLVHRKEVKLRPFM